MRIGLGMGGATVDDAVEAVRQAAAEGFATASFSNIFGLDAITICGIAGRELAREGLAIELGTFVVPTYPRHPVAMAQQALTTHAACEGRFLLGIGLSHQIVIETMWGFSFEKPARHMREYLSVLMPLLREGTVSFQGATAEYRPRLPRSGAYRVEVFIPAHVANASVEYRVMDRPGQPDAEIVTPALAQGRFSNQSVSLGDYDFDPALPDAGKVSLTDLGPDEPARTVVFGAVRWVPLPR